MASIQAQDCIDIEEIKEDLGNLGDECNCSITLILGTRGGTTNISTYQLGTLIQNECIQVLGTLVIDQITYFDNCDLIFDEEALIQVNNNVINVGFTDCTLQSCGEYHWKGIDIGKGNNFFFRNNIMQHSLYGLHNNSGQTFAWITNNIFNDNLFAIYIGTDEVQNRSGLTLMGNIFARTNEDFQSIGVLTSNTIVNSSVVNDPCQETNVFIGLYTAYEFDNSIAEIHSDLFRDSWTEGIYSYGIGIYADERRPDDFLQSSVRQSGWPTNDIETFDNVPRPIFMTRTITDVRDNIIRNSVIGISVTQPKMVSNIKNNNVQTLLGFGIHLSGNKIPSEIEDNFVQINNEEPIYYSHAIGINVVSLPGGGTSIRSNSHGTLIRNNEVELNPGHRGIYIQGGGVREYKVACNTIAIKDPIEDYTSGIEISGGYRNHFEKNEIAGLYSSSTASEINGIKIVESQENLLTDNRTRNTMYGLHFSNWNDHTRQQWNQLEDHDYGYYIAEESMTGEQEHARNQWLGTFTNWAALNDGDEDLSPYEGFENLVNTDCWPQTISPDQGWFIDIPGTGSCGPNIASPCDFQVDAGIERLTYIDTLVARNELDFENYDVERKWQTQMYLVRRLIDYPELVGNPGSLMDSFLHEVQTTVLWDYYTLQREIEDYSIIPEGLANNWYEMYDQYKNLIGDSELAINQWLVHPDSTELAEPIAEIYMEIDSIWTDAVVPLQNWRSNYVQNLDNLLPQVLALSTPNQYAANQKLVLEATVKMVINEDSLGSSLTTSLIQLAESCLLEHGPAVIDASGILQRLGIQHENFDLHCTESSGERRGEEISEESPSFDIFPNPSSGTFYIGLNKIPEEEGKVEIFDRNGKLMHSQILESNTLTQEVSAASLTPGQYTILVTHDGKVDSGSIIITR